MKMSDEPRADTSPQGRSPSNEAPSRTTVPGERTLTEGLLHYIGIIWGYKWLVIVMTALGAIGSVVFAHHQPPASARGQPASQFLPGECGAPSAAWEQPERVGHHHGLPGC